MLVAIGLFIFYFLPTFIAIFSGQPNTAAIFMLNLFMGWTGIGWVFAIIWAVLI